MIMRNYAYLFVGLAFFAGTASTYAQKIKPVDTKAEVVSSDPQITTATFGDWTERCQRVNTNDGIHRICEVAQTINVTNNGQTSPLAALSIGRTKKGAPLRLTLVLPVDVAFPSIPKVTVEGADSLDLTWRQCVPAGCFSDVAFGTDTEDNWRAAKTAKVEFKTSSGNALNFQVSLKGLSQALNALAKDF